MADFTVSMSGGAPWGFSMAGGVDFNQALNISKVTPGGKAAAKGLRPGLAILRINGQDVTNFRHIDATQFVKQCGRAGTLSLTLDTAGAVRQGEDLNSILGNISTVPTMHRQPEPSVPSYQPEPISSFKPAAATTSTTEQQWKPSTFTPATTKPTNSPIKTVKPPNSTHSFGSEPVHVAASIPPPASFVPTPKPAAAPAPKVSSPPVSTAPVATFKSSPEPDLPRHDLRNPEKSGVLRLPTVNFPQSQPIMQSKPADAKTNALGNISSFMNKKTLGAVNNGTLGKPEFLQGLVDRECPLGEPAVLEVRVAGTPPLTVQWYHNNQPVRESLEKDIRLLQKGPVYTLVYGELKQQLLGRYTCQASNGKGNVTSSCILTEGGYDELDDYPTATYAHGPPPPSNPAYAKTVPTQQAGLPAKTKVITKKPLNQLVTSGNANLYSSNAIEEGLHSALGIEPEADGQMNESSHVLAAIEGRDNQRSSKSRIMSRLAQQFDDDLDL